ncbi:MAG: alanine racemase [Rhodobacteraceae bacterium]|nr:alanine racemase [Paracoccaceae bacterium]
MAWTAKTIETPALIVNEAVALGNIARFQRLCDKRGLLARPHIKTHKSVHFAKAQMAAGAVGITCQKIAEAEVMAAGGLQDILIAFNIVGSGKLARLRRLTTQVARLAVVADDAAVITGLAQACAGASSPVGVMVECDSGGARCGIQRPEAAPALAKQIMASPGLHFAGLMTYPAAGAAGCAVAFMRAALGALEAAGLPCPCVSSGGTPDLHGAGTHGLITEYRAGTYIYNDRSLVLRGACKQEACAAQVLATVVSTPTPRRAVIDAGSKVLTSDMPELGGYGSIYGHPQAQITALSEEHGVIHSDCEGAFTIGDRLRILPNHVCVVSNMLDYVWLEREGAPCERLPIDARGCVL